MTERVGRKPAPAPGQGPAAIPEGQKAPELHPTRFDPAQKVGPHQPVDSVGDQAGRQKHQDTLMGGGELGRDGVTPAELTAMGAAVAGRHLMTLLARRRGTDRAALIREVGDLILGLDRALARRLLLELGDAGRIIDVYPLEILDEVVRRRPGFVDGVEPGPIVLNKAALEAETHAVEVPIVLEVGLGLKMKALALAGGGTPGYMLSPGPPALYHLELGEAGTFTFLVRGDLRKKSYIDRLTLKVIDRGPPDSG